MSHSHIKKYNWIINQHTDLDWFDTKTHTWSEKSIFEEIVILNKER